MHVVGVVTSFHAQLDIFGGVIAEGHGAFVKFLIHAGRHRSHGPRGGQIALVVIEVFTAQRYPPAVIDGVAHVARNAGPAGTAGAGPEAVSYTHLTLPT